MNASATHEYVLCSMCVRACVLACLCACVLGNNRRRVPERAQKDQDRDGRAKRSGGQGKGGPIEVPQYTNKETTYYCASTRQVGPSTNLVVYDEPGWSIVATLRDRLAGQAAWTDCGLPA